MGRPFERVFHVRWGDMDFNAHMKNTAYLDMSGDVRMMYFAGSKPSGSNFSFQGSASMRRAFNSVQDEERVRAVYGEAKYARLAKLKAHRDPGNVFRMNQNIVPFS